MPDIAPPKSILITLAGRDRPGITNLVFSILSRFEVELLDLEQILIRGRLVLAALISAPADRVGLEKELSAAATELQLSLDFGNGHSDQAMEPGGRNYVTVLGSPLTARAMSTITGCIFASGANIERIDRIASYPITAIQLDVSGVATEQLRTLLAPEAHAHGIDIAVQSASLMRRALKLIVMDVDSTLVQGEVIEMLAAHAGKEAEVARVTEAAMRGELDFTSSLMERVSHLAGLDESVFDHVYRDLQLTPGARTTIRVLKRLGYRFAMVSGGFTQITEKLAADLGIDYQLANTLEVVDGRLTGRVTGPVVDRAAKAAALRHFADQAGIPEQATIAIGDGANDLDMLNAAGLGIAFNAKPIVQQAADTAVNTPYFDAVLYLLGITREEIEADDAARGLQTPAPPIDS
ncbi:MAG TPA: phosphoserine phosphatase SerB [Marmoricola sp.]|nr:phosphoserine phosphatase SerB [Marmoricola sp.]HNN47420.1 phosphoserine phosphatase SerB [Marmoricola sp.]